jgi:hypothetical protein
MLSMLLSMEELESLVIPYCHVFENHLHSSLPLLLSCSSTSSYIIKPWFNPFSYRHHRLTSRPCRCLIFHRFSFTSRTEYVHKHPSKLNSIKLSFQQAIIRMNRVPNKRVVPILLRRCNLSKADFRLRSAQCFCHISLYGSSKLMILDALEIRFKGASEYELFFHCTYLIMCSNFDWNSTFPLKPCRWLTIFIAIGQELMGILHHAYKKNQMHILPPGWWSGVEITVNKPNTSLRS